jgi:hypothetical protein
MVMIGIDPHKGTHTVVAIDDREQVLTERLVRATHGQVPELVGWADQTGRVLEPDVRDPAACRKLEHDGAPRLAAPRAGPVVGTGFWPPQPSTLRFRVG